MRTKRESIKNIGNVGEGKEGKPLDVQPIVALPCVIYTIQLLFTESPIPHS